MTESAAQKMADYRRRERARVLRQLTPWAPARDDPEFLRQRKEDEEILRYHPSTREGDEFVEAALAALESKRD